MQSCEITSKVLENFFKILRDVGYWETFSPQADDQLVPLLYLLHKAQLLRSLWRRRHFFRVISDNWLRSRLKNAIVCLNFPTMQRRKSRRSTVWMRTRAFR